MMYRRQLAIWCVLAAGSIGWAQESSSPAKPTEPPAAQVKAVPSFKDGLAQEVEGFKDSNSWIRHDLWVETEFDSDGNGKRDRNARRRDAPKTN